MDRERPGVSLTQGEPGMDASSEGRWRELERRRPREPRVSGGRTLVEDARCLLGGGTGREADMGRAERIIRGRGTEAGGVGPVILVGAYGRPTRWSSLIFLSQRRNRHHVPSQSGRSLAAGILLTSSRLRILRLPPPAHWAPRPTPLPSTPSGPISESDVLA